MICIIHVFRTIVFIFVIFTTFRSMCPPIFDRCNLMVVSYLWFYSWLKWIKKKQPASPPAEINDDFLICWSSENMVTIERKMQQCIHKILKLNTKNSFKISSNKTKCMHFYQIHKIHNQTTVTLNGSEIPITKQYKFLSITLDPKLSFIPTLNKWWSNATKLFNSWEP